MSFWNRVGTFFILLGIGFVLIFLFSDIAGTAELRLLIAGAGSLFLGFILKRISPAARPEPSGRFRLVKETRQKREERRKKRKEKKDKRKR